MSPKSQNAKLANGTVIRITHSQVVAGKKRYQKAYAPNAAAARAVRAASKPRRVRKSKKKVNSPRRNAPNAAAATAAIAAAAWRPSPSRSRSPFGSNSNNEMAPYFTNTRSPPSRHAPNAAAAYAARAAAGYV